ncbi:MAG TPA: Bax inhibitor-1/YccA family protein [Clostridia bacterium]|nr:Bax inhibitor-1/YccA family protein [Clostridia bacterium]
MEYQGTVVRPEDGIRAFFNRVYGWMAGGLALTAAIAWLVGTSTAMQQVIFGNPIVLILLIVAEFGLVIGLSRAINRMSPQTAGLLFLAYAAVNGLTLSSIFMVYASGDITMAFVASAGLFLAMSLIGSATHMDLSRLGNIALVGLFAIIGMSIINIFTKSSGLEFLISIVGIVVFLGLTAWDTQKLRRMALNLDPAGDNPITMAGGNPQAEKAAVIGALSLYLDLVNLFLFVLRFFSGRRRS